jgi:hypothetical protein
MAAARRDGHQPERQKRPDVPAQGERKLVHRTSIALCVSQKEWMAIATSKAVDCGVPTVACWSAATHAVLRTFSALRTLRAMKRASLLLPTAAAGLGALSVTRDASAL